MGIYDRPHFNEGRRRLTMEELKEQMYSLNMRLRLAMVTGNEELRQSLEQQLQEVRGQMEELAGR